MLTYPPRSVTFLRTTVVQNQRCGKFKSRTIRTLSTLSLSLADICSKLERFEKNSRHVIILHCTVKKCYHKYCMFLHQLRGSKNNWRQFHFHLISSRLCHVVKSVFGKVLIHGLLSNCIIIIIIIIIMRNSMTIGSEI